MIFDGRKEGKEQRAIVRSFVMYVSLFVEVNDDCAGGITNIL